MPCNIFELNRLGCPHQLRQSKPSAVFYLYCRPSPLTRTAQPIEFIDTSEINQSLYNGVQYLRIQWAGLSASTGEIHLASRQYTQSHRRAVALTGMLCCIEYIGCCFTLCVLLSRSSYTGSSNLCWEHEWVVSTTEVVSRVAYWWQQTGKDVVIVRADILEKFIIYVCAQLRKRKKVGERENRFWGFSQKCLFKIDRFNLSQILFWTTIFYYWITACNIVLYSFKNIQGNKFHQNDSQNSE